MNYQQTLELIHSHSKLKYVPSLDRIKRLTEFLGNPQEKLRTIHITGTNGKGTVSMILRDLLSASGYRVGIFTSPFLEDFKERIAINDSTITEDELAFYADKTESILQKNDLVCNEFEFITAIAFQWFYDKNCDFVVLEVGLGGEFDPTNIINSPLFSVITSVSLDHTKFLGKTVEDIARVKSGIIKEHTPVIVRENLQCPVLDIIKKTAKEKNAPLHLAIPEEITIMKSNEQGRKIRFKDTELSVSMLGDGFIENLSVIFKACELFGNFGIEIKDEALKRVIEGVKIPARLERINYLDRNIILDAGHNPESIQNAVNALKTHNFKLPLTLLYASMRDKDFDTCLKILSEVTKNAVLTETENSRSEGADKLLETALKYNISAMGLKGLQEAFLKALELTENGGTLLVIGSFYLVGEVRKNLKVT